MDNVYLLDKPEDCKLCPYAGVGQGFCPDWSPPDPKIAVLCEAAGANEIVEKEPLVGAAGWVFTRRFLFDLGYTRADVLIANVLRCNPPSNVYPIADLRKKAESFCRIYDSKAGKDLQPGGLESFKPNTFLVTIHPSAVNRTWTLMRVVQNDMAKAFRLATQGRRVLVLMGDKALNLVAPQLHGVSKWRGHYGDLDWPKFRERFLS